VAIDTSTRTPRDYRLHDRAIIFLMSPIQSLIRGTLDFAVDVGQNYLFLWSARNDHHVISEENRRLQGTIAQLQEAQLENQRLRRLMDFQEENKLK
jgi:hypothetical protein